MANYTEDKYSKGTKTFTCIGYAKISRYCNGGHFTIVTRWINGRNVYLEVYLLLLKYLIWVALMAS